MRRLFLVLALAWLGPVHLADAGPAQSSRFARTPVKPHLSQQARRRLAIGSVAQAKIGRPRTLRRLSSQVVARRLRKLLARHPERRVADLEKGYDGYRSVRSRIHHLAGKYRGRVKVTKIGDSEGLAIERIDFVAQKPASDRWRVLIIGGVHAGTEQVGVEAATQFAERVAKDSGLRDTMDVTIVPMANPTGLILGTRKNHDELDVNRTFKNGQWTAESRAVRRVIDDGNFDVVLDLHGAGTKGRNGFFMIKGKDDGGMSRRVLSAMEGGALLDDKGAGKTYALSSLGSATSSNGGTLKAYAIEKGASYSYTLEAPTRMSPELQVRGTVKLLRSALYNIRDHGQR